MKIGEPVGLIVTFSTEERKHIEQTAIVLNEYCDKCSMWVDCQRFCPVYQSCARGLNKDTDKPTVADSLLNLLNQDIICIPD